MHNDNNDCIFNTFYIAGVGCDDSGCGSAFCFIEKKTNTTYKVPMGGLTTNAAKYHALLNVVRYLPAGSEAYVLTDSTILCRDYNGTRWVQDETLRDIAGVTEHLIQQKKVTIHISKIKRNKNPAWKALASFGKKQRPKNQI